MESFITILNDIEKQWLSRFAWKTIVIRPVPRTFICLAKKGTEPFKMRKKMLKKIFNLAWLGGMIKKIEYDKALHHTF